MGHAYNERLHVEGSDVTVASGTRLGSYQVLSGLGSGGMGEVYRAHDVRLGRIVALKVLPPGLTTDAIRRERFAREARAVASLSHPHICSLYDFGNDKGVDYLVMEYLEGETLQDRLIAGPIQIGDVVRYAAEIADALDHAHRHGFVHRDLKPANVFVTKSGTKLLDFGLAKAIRREPFLESESTAEAKVEGDRNLTAEWNVVGTLNYMAPERLEGREADARSDLFAFGALVYEMATRRKAFDGGNAASVIAAIISAEPPALNAFAPVVPPLLDRVVRQCLAKDPAERWQNAHDLKTVLQSIEHVRPETHDSERPVRRRWRTQLIGIGAGALLLASIVAIGFGSRAGSRPSSDNTPVQFVISAPEDSTLFSGGGVMALSPDGRHLAIVATPRDGEPLLWIRSLDAVAPRPLAGTTQGSQPFWSPDSRFVAFSADGKLKKVNVASGEVQILCDDEALAGTWSRGGDILFRSNRMGGIARVPASGGRPEPVTKVDSSRGEFSHNWPSFLPDGRHFLFLVWSTQPEHAGIYVGSLDGPERERVLSDRTQAIFVEPGYLLFHRTGLLLAQRFNLVAQTVSGDALPLVSDVAFNPRTSRGVFSVSDTGVLAYRAAEDNVLGWYDRKGALQGAIGLAGLDRDPAISPDGRTVAVARLNPQTRTTSIWLVDSDGSAARRFTFDPHGDSAPIWSPDGTRIAFASQRGGRAELYVKSFTSSSPEELLLSLSNPIVPTDWSRDGRFLVFSQLSSTTRHDLLALPLQGDRRPSALVETSEFEDRGKLSPDGRWLVYESSETGAFEVYVRPVHGPPKDKIQVSNQGGIEPTWRRDGKELFYLGLDQRLMAVDIRTAPHFEAGTPVPLFETRTVSPAGPNLGIVGRNQYDVSADGQRFLINAPLSASSKPITVVVNWPAMLPH